MDCSLVSGHYSPESGLCSPVHCLSPRHRSTLRSDSRHFDSRRSGSRHFDSRYFDSRHSEGPLSDSRRCIQEVPSGTWKQKKKVNFKTDFQALIIDQDMAPIG